WRWWRTREAGAGVRHPGAVVGPSHETPSGANIEAGLVVSLWLLWPCLFFLWHFSPVFPHYFILLFPAPFLLAGLSFDWLVVRWRWLWLAPLSIAAAQAWVGLALLAFINTQATPGAFGTPLGLLLRTTDAARQLNRPEVLVVAEGADSSQDFA